MKDGKDIVRSRNGRLNQARRHATALKLLLIDERRPSLANDESWSALFAEARDLAADILQAVHEASAYNNVLLGHTVKEETDYTPAIEAEAK